MLVSLLKEKTNAVLTMTLLAAFYALLIMIGMILCR